MAYIKYLIEGSKREERNIRYIKNRKKKCVGKERGM
jgi:hypothetical protein